MCIRDRATAVPELPFKPRERKQELMFSDGGLQDVLRHARDPDQRLTAIFATRRMRSKEAIPILKLALRDPSDDVRLLAYSMLDQRESRINQRIEHALASMDSASTDRKIALHGELARWYLSLIHIFPSSAQGIPGAAAPGIEESAAADAPPRACAQAVLQPRFRCSA